MKPKKFWRVYPLIMFLIMVTASVSYSQNLLSVNRIDGNDGGGVTSSAFACNLSGAADSCEIKSESNQSPNISAMLDECPLERNAALSDTRGLAYVSAIVSATQACDTAN